LDSVNAGGNANAAGVYAHPRCARGGTLELRPRGRGAATTVPSAAPRSAPSVPAAVARPHLILVARARREPGVEVVRQRRLRDLTPSPKISYAATPTLSVLGTPDVVDRRTLVDSEPAGIRL